MRALCNTRTDFHMEKTGVLQWGRVSLLLPLNMKLSQNQKTSLIQNQLYFICLLRIRIHIKIQETVQNQQPCIYTELSALR